MTGILLHSIAKELIAQEVGLKFVQVARNFDNYNPPQSVLPAAVVSIINDETGIFVGGMQRPEYGVIISVSFLDYNVDLTHTSDELMQKQQEVYSIVDRIQELFNHQEFMTDAMKELVTTNNLITRARGYNYARDPYGKSSLNVITYDLSIRAILTLPPRVNDTIPIKKVEIEEINIE